MVAYHPGHASRIFHDDVDGSYIRVAKKRKKKRRLLTAEPEPSAEGVRDWQPGQVVGKRGLQKAGQGFHRNTCGTEPRSLALEGKSQHEG